MITVTNYPEQIKSVDVDKLPKELREGHLYVNEFGDLYNDDSEIKGAIDLYLDKLNKNIGGGKATTAAREKKTRTKKPKQAVKAKTEETPCPEPEKKATEDQKKKPARAQRKKATGTKEKPKPVEKEAAAQPEVATAAEIDNEIADTGKQLGKMSEADVLRIGREFEKKYRSHRSQVRDESRDARRRLSPKPENLIRWMKHPGQFDLIGVDTFKKTDATADFTRIIGKQKVFALYGIKV